MANLLSLIRLALALPFAWLIAEGDARSAPLFALGIASDLLDGRVARRRGAESALGRALDHGADFAFVSAGLWSAAGRDLVPVLLPAAVAIAFAQYVLDSLLAHRTRVLRMSALGRWNGILYFVPLGGVCLIDLGLPLGAATAAVAWLLVVTTGLSILDRALASGRTARAARAAGTPGRSPH